MKTKIKMILFVLCGVVILTLLFFSVGLINYNTTTEQNFINNETDIKTNETQNQTCVILTDGRTACLIASNITLTAGQIQNLTINK